MRKSLPPATPAPSPEPVRLESTTTSPVEFKILARLIQQLAVCTATAESLLEALLSKEVEAITFANSSTYSTSSNSSTLKSDTSENRGSSAGPSTQTNISVTRPGKVNPMGSNDKFGSGDLSLNGFRQHLYNGFTFDLPPRDYKGPVYDLVTRGRRVGIFSSWAVASPYVDKCKGNAFASVTSVNGAYELMKVAIDNKTACWLKD